MPTKRKIDLNGPEGNAFALMAIGRTFASQLDIDFDPILKDMMSSNYAHLLDVFEKHFGELAELINKP